MQKLDRKTQSIIGADVTQYNLKEISEVIDLIGVVRVDLIPPNEFMAIWHFVSMNYPEGLVVDGLTYKRILPYDDHQEGLIVGNTQLYYEEVISKFSIIE